MKKILLGLFLLPCFSYAGTITTSFSPLGTITYSSGTVAASPAIAVDASSASRILGGTSPLSWTLTVGSGNNRAIVVACGGNSAVSIASITVGGFGLNLATSNVDASHSQNTFIYVGTGPTIGANTIAVNYSGATGSSIDCGAVSFFNVAQTSPVDVATGTIRSPSPGTLQQITLTTLQANDILVDVCTGDQDSAPIVIVAGQTQQWQLKGNQAVGSSTKPTTTAGAYTMGWTAVDGGPQTGIALKQAP